MEVSENSRDSNLGERGSALLMSVFVLALVGAMGVGLLFMTNTEIKMSRTGIRVKQAYYVAEAGEEDGRATLHAINGRNQFDTVLGVYAGANGAFDLDPAALAPTYDASGNVTALVGFGDDVPLRPVTRFAGGWYAAFVTNDPIDGVTSTTDTNDLVMITSIGGGPDRAVEVVQAIVERWDILTDLPPATITLLGPTPDFQGGNSNVHDYLGDDCGSNNPNTPYVPVVGTIGSAAETNAELGITGGPNYEAGPYENEDTFVDLTNPSDPLLADIGYGGPPAAWTDCDALHQITEDFRSVADHYCAGDSCPLPATAINEVIFIDGDFVINPPGGRGTLIVTGELRYNGKASWNGMIFVFGEGRFIQQGSGNGEISGSIMVADIAGADETYGTADDCGSGLGITMFDLSGGGNAATLYCRSNVLDAWPNPPYRIVNFRQM